MKHKIVNGSVEIDNKVYTAFELFDKTWGIVEGKRISDLIVGRNIQSKTSRQAVVKWLEQKNETTTLSEV